MAFFKEVVVIVSPSAIVIDRLLDAVCPPLVTCMERLLVPTAVGVPVITPADDKLKPEGRLPVSTDHK